MNGLSGFLSIVIVACTIFGMANSSESVSNKANDNMINNIKITVTKNYHHYIDNNDKKELIEDPDDELANNKLLEYTGGCIGAKEVYTKKNENVFNEIYTDKKCDLSLQNESDSHQVFDLKSTNVQPLTCGNLNAGSNTTTKLNCNVETDKLNIKKGASVIQCGNVKAQKLRIEKYARLNLKNRTMELGNNKDTNNNK